jgi:PAS domain S-box-containing protein
MRLGTKARWSVRRILWTCFLPLVAVLIALATISIWQIHRTSDLVAHVSDVRQPLETTAFNMSIAAAVLENGISSYSTNSGAAQVDSVREAEDEFGQLAAQFNGLAETPQDKQIGQNLTSLYNSFKGAPDEIVGKVDQQYAAMVLFRKDVTSLDTLIDSTVRATDISSPDAGTKIAAAIDMRASLDMVSSAVESYRNGPNASLRQAVSDAQSSFRQSLTAYQSTQMSAYEQQWLTLVDGSFSTVITDASNEMGLTDSLGVTMSSFGETMGNTMAYLENNASPLLAVSTAAAMSDVQSTAASSTRLLIILASLSVIVATICIVALSRMIVRPIRNLLRGAEAVDSGKLDYRFDVDARGELGELALGLNRMLDGIQRSKAVLGESEETAWQILDSTTDSVILTDLRGLILASNEIAAERYKKSLEQMIDTNFYDLLPEDLRASRKAQIAEVIRTGKSVHFEDERDGMVLDHRIYPVPGPRGEVSRIAIFARDVTTHKWVEEVTEQLRRRNELILEAAGEGIYGLDTEGKTTFVNPSAAKMLGYRPEDLIGQLHHELVHHSRADGRVYPQSQCPIYAAFKDGTVHTSVDNEVFWRRDGSSFPVEYTSTPIIDKGSIVGAVVTFRDITERKRIEEALRTSEEGYRSVFESAANMIVSIDRSGTIIDCNTRSEEMLGYKAGELVGRSLLELIHPDDREKAQVSLSSVLYKGFDYNKRYRMIRKDGSYIDLRMNAAAARDTAGKYVRTICMIDRG